MKKNISINISGIIFHIEEDGYDKLKQYLDSINKYFSSYEDSSEIIADIESRIAEIFLSKLREGKQVITLEDINFLIATMGSVKDFQAAEDKEESDKSTSGSSEGDDQKQENAYSDPLFSEAMRPKRLERDGKRKILGGVAAGIANYLNIDPIWIRLLFIILFFNIFFTYHIGFPLLIGYIALWILLPESFNIEEDKKIKKLYRNPDDKILGGVSSGIAAYFALDPLVVRLLFVVSILLGGSGVIVYIILWIITPEANSITEKMQMQGEPVTLHNIENNIKKSFNVKDSEEEPLFAKIILFPFRLLSAFFKGLAKGLGPFLIFLADIIRIFAGVIIFITALAIMIALFAFTGILFGSAFIWDWSFLPDLPIEQIREIFPALSKISAFILIFIPLLLIAVLGLGIIAKKNFIHQTLGWTLFAGWIVCILIFSFSTPGTVLNFKSEGIYSNTEIFETDNRQILLSVKDTGNEDYQVTSLRLRGHDGNVLLLEQNFKSRGRTRENAKANAEAVVYNVAQQDSVIIFDSNIQFSAKTPFRFQTLDMTLYIPYNKEFRMQKEMANILRNTIYRAGFHKDQIANNTWVFKEEGLHCLTCPEPREKKLQNEVNISSNGVSVNLEGFKKIDISGYYELHIKYGNSYSVKFDGRQKDIDNIKAEVVGNELQISPKKKSFNLGKESRKVKIFITMPEMSHIQIAGVVNTHISGFKVPAFEIDLAGASKCEADIDAENFIAEVAGACTLNLRGKGKNMKVKVAGASKVNAFDFTAESVEVDAVGASKVHVSASTHLDAEAIGASKVVYKGDPQVRSSAQIASSVEKY